MAMNIEKVNLRKEKVRQLISGLDEVQRRAETDYRWYRSGAFRAAIESGETWRVPPVRSVEEAQRFLNTNGQQERVRELLSQSGSLPDHAGTRTLKPHPARVAIIADTFLYETFEGTANITYLTPTNYQQVAAECDVLLIASTWRGRFEEWHGTSNTGGKVLQKVIPLFRSHGVPIVFYSKEDPPNYVRFRPLAAAADVVFTSAEEMIPVYQRDCPNVSHVQSLTFGVNPFLHTPVGSRRIRQPEILFAGSWLSHKYPRRQKAARVLFDGVLRANRDLLIIDRNSTLGDEKYFYPQEYLDHVGPGVGHRELMKLQRTFDVQLNLNSVIDSPTMYANRVVELQAMGKFVLSNYSMVVNDLYPEVQLIDRAKEVPLILDSMTGDELYRAQTDGLRRVWAHDTAWQRMGDILQSVGAPRAQLRESAALIAAPGDVAWAREIAQKQSVPVAVVDRDDFDRARNDFDVLIPVSPDQFYSHEHVRDLLNVFRFADVDFATKDGYEGEEGLVLGKDHELVTQAAEASRSAIRTENSAVMEEWSKSGEVRGTGYSTAPIGAGPVRATSIKVHAPRKPKLAVVVPVYNNGQYLVSKCFRSLQRSSIFDDMEVLLIDDGSTDTNTRMAVHELAARHPNVRKFLFPIGGSGSASRPRNLGLELATADHITYLDPDNEALNDGFAVLLEKCLETGVDFAIGNMLKLTRTRWLVNNTYLLNKHLPLTPDGTLEVPSDVMTRIRFQPMSIQALVARTEWLREMGLNQPEGALGQDSFAFQQMLHNADRIATVSLAIHVYYGAVSNSMVNTVGPGFYRKYLPLELRRKEWLEQEGLLEDYCRLRVDAFYDGWFLTRYNKGVRPEDKAECKSILDELCAMYGVMLEAVDDKDPNSPLVVQARKPTSSPDS